MNKKIYFLTGPPLSGKDTQGKLLAKKIKARFLVTSKLVELFFDKQNKNYLKIGKKIFNINKERKKRYSGGFYSPEIVAHVIVKKIEDLIAKTNLIFSGSPRLLEETKILLNFLKKNKIEFKIIFLEISENEIFKRALKRHRGKEDFKNIVQERIDNYKKNILPTIKFLEKRGYLIKINGEGDVLKIHRRIISALKNKLF